MITLSNSTEISNKLKKQISMLERLKSQSAEQFIKFVATAFYNRVLARLKGGYDTAQYSNLVKLEVSKDICRVVVKDNYEGIMEFLEFGTGLLGKQNPHNRASSRGWEYAIHEQEYKNHNGNRGFIFILKDGYYLAQNDEVLSPRRAIIFSQGIKPLRYWYDTVDEFEVIFNSSKTAEEIKKKVLKLGAIL